MSQECMPGFATNAIHAGAHPDPVTGSVVTPIYQSAAYVFPSTTEAADRFALKKFGQIYGRVTNPTQDVLEERVTALEGGTASLAVASGLAAQFIAFQTLMEPGDEFVSAKQLYGGTVTQFTHTYKRFGWNVKWADINDLSSFEKQINDKTKAIYADTIANPDGRVVDLEALAKIAEKNKLPFLVDNTVATPYLCRPFEYGADVVVHSLTKFLGGHGNSMGGIIVDGGSFDWSKSGRAYPCLTDPRPEYNGLKFHETFGKIAFAIACRGLGLQPLGPSISPFNAFQIITGIETLPLRMEKHCSNALKVAEFLSKHDKVKWVSYAGLPSDPHHNLVKRYMPKGAGSVFTFSVKGGYDAGVKVVSNVKLFSHLANIGDTRSLIIHPASTTHSQLSDEHKIAAGCGPDTIRVSVGLEDAADITADLDQALKAA